MKHQNHIVAFDKEHFGDLPHDLNFMDMHDFLDRSDDSLILARRDMLEDDERYGQALPYILFYNWRGEEIQFFTYQRRKGVGEERLLGKMSIGIGGHVDLSDVVAGNSVIDAFGTFDCAVYREIGEEVQFKNGDDEIEKEYHLPITFIGVLNDQTDSVGRVHYGLLMAIEMPDDYKINTLEPELLDIGMKSVEELKSMDLEGWSRIVLDNIDDVVDNL
jgi:predicted NUDIX family phosphoesterase